MNCAERIRELREDRDINQSTIAKIIGVAQNTYSNYEHGLVKIPIDALITLAEFYNVDMNYISGVSNKKECFPVK